MRCCGSPGMICLLCIVAYVFALDSAAAGGTSPEPNAPKAEIRTPKPPQTPRINGPSIFAVRPGHPFLYLIPATGARPMEFSVESLPAGLAVDARTGQITGSLKEAGEHIVTLRAKNALGASEKKFKIVVGETIALTPPMGWNSWNAYHGSVTGENVIHAARAMASSGLIQHGWTYINIDDAWQSKRGGPFNAIQPNEKFPDFQKMCDKIHALGLKVGIYSTPWTTSYARYIGGSSDDPNGDWSKGGGRRNGKVSFAEADARQWAAWGIDYLKYDWNPNQTTPRETSEMFHQDTDTMRKALRNCGRDIIFSYSNGMRFDDIADQSKMLNCWRTTGDIGDSWQSMASKAFYVDIPRGQTEPARPSERPLGRLRRPRPLERSRHDGPGCSQLRRQTTPDSPHAR